MSAFKFSYGFRALRRANRTESLRSRQGRMYIEAIMATLVTLDPASYPYRP